MPCKKKSKRRTTRKRYSPTNQALKVVDTGIKVTAGVAALGITATALNNIAKT